MADQNETQLEREERKAREREAWAQWRRKHGFAASRSAQRQRDNETNSPSTAAFPARETPNR